MKNLISIIIDTQSLIDFFKKAPSWGTSDKPYKADSFCTVDAPNLLWRGGRILTLEPSSSYEIELLSKPIKTDVKHLKEDCAEVIFTAITDDVVTIEDWKNIFILDNKDCYTYDKFRNELTIKQELGKALMVQTAPDYSPKFNLQYAIYFEIKETGKIGVIDPYIGNTSSEPDEK